MSNLITPAALVVALCATPAFADSKDRHAAGGGMDVYYSVVAAADISKYPNDRPERLMHGGVPSNKAYRHVMVTVYDSSTKQRVDNASVSAKVADLTEMSEEKRLEPMVIDGTVSYGNYFRMSGRGPYRISLQLARPGTPKKTEIRFDYTP